MKNQDDGTALRCLLSQSAHFTLIGQEQNDSWVSIASLRLLLTHSPGHEALGALGALKPQETHGIYVQPSWAGSRLLGGLIG